MSGWHIGSSPAYPSDLPDAQWALIEPLVPVLSTRGKGARGGRPPKFPRRRIVDAIMYLDRRGCSWRRLPHDFPPWDTAYFNFSRWAADGTVDRIHDALRDAVWDAAGRDPLASAGAVDSQTVPAAATVGKGSRGWDAGKKTNGRKRHLVVDTMGPAARGAGDRGQRAGPQRRRPGAGPGEDGHTLTLLTSRELGPL